MIKLDGCESVIFSDGSVRINTPDNRYLCLDYSEIKILHEKARKQLELKELKTMLPQLEEMADTEY